MSQIESEGEAAALLALSRAGNLRIDAPVSAGASAVREPRASAAAQRQRQMSVNAAAPSGKRCASQAAMCALMLCIEFGMLLDAGKKG